MPSSFHLSSQNSTMSFIAVKLHCQLSLYWEKPVLQRPNQASCPHSHYFLSHDGTNSKMCKKILNLYEAFSLMTHIHHPYGYIFQFVQSYPWFHPVQFTHCKTTNDHVQLHSKHKSIKIFLKEKNIVVIQLSFLMIEVHPPFGEGGGQRYGDTTSPKGVHTCTNGKLVLLFSHLFQAIVS